MARTRWKLGQAAVVGRREFLGYDVFMGGGSIQITVEVPAALVDEQTPERARVLLVLDAVRSERLSWRAAARELDLSASAFLDLARDHGVPVVRYDAADWHTDIATLDKLSSRRRDDG